MPNIKTISDLRKNFSEISRLYKDTNEPVYITKNGTIDMVIMSIETYEKQQGQLELYAKLTDAETEIAAGAKGVDFFKFAKKMRTKLTKK